MAMAMPRSLVWVVLVASLLAGAPPAVAASSPIGTWVKKAEPGKPAVTMTIDSWGPTMVKVTYNIKDPPIVLTVVSALNGADAPVLLNGKPSGETMAIKLIDPLHSNTIVKMNGKPFGTSKGTFSADFNTLTVENDFSAGVGGNPAGKSTEVWTRK
jgi:hypothetical protein